MYKKLIPILIYFVLLPVVIIAGTIIFQYQQYAWISLCTAVAACIPFFISFESKHTGAKQLIIIAVMIALSVAGRILFAPIPGFKPVTALIILSAMYFGRQAGFMTGALTAVLSNFYFGQGPWTPFQMFAWGLVGFIAGCLTRILKKHIWALLTFGAISGILFSAIMDIWSVLWWDGSFQLSRYVAMVLSSFGFAAVYAGSNVVFLLLLAKPIGKKLERVKIKYGLQSA